MHRLLLLLTLVLVLPLAGCVSPPEAAPSPSATAAVWPLDWQVARYRDNPLVGRIWQPATQSWVTPAQLRDAVAGARFVVLGETHDNPDHHRLQAELLQAVVAASRRPALAFEMLDLDQQPALQTFLGRQPIDAAGLGEAVGWADSGWPAWSMYQPIAQVALQHELPIEAANFSSATVKSIAIDGFDAALEPSRVAALGLDAPLPAAWDDTMREELYKSHCELMPKAALTGMVRAQRARNAIMAERLVADATADGGVLIAGAGHARTDFGVPMVLHAKTPDANVVSVAMLEVSADGDRPQPYAQAYNVERLPFDYVLFTPAADREDPCVALRERFKKPRAAK